MAVRVRDLNQSGERFERRAQQAVGEYLDGVEQGANWEQAAAAAQGAWGQGVQQAVQRGSYERGVRRAGNTRFQEGVRTKGATRYPQGVAGSGQRWVDGFRPFGDAIAAQNLPRRGPRRSQENRQRMLANLDTIIRVKEQQLGGRTS